MTVCVHVQWKPLKGGGADLVGETRGKFFR